MALFFGIQGLWLSVFGGVLTIWSFDYVGHIASQDSVLLVALLTFDLIAVAFWVGILAPLKRSTTTPSLYAEAADVGHRFGRVATIVIPALIIAGGYMSYQLTGSFATLAGTAY